MDSELVTTPNLYSLTQHKIESIYEILKHYSFDKEYYVKVCDLMHKVIHNKLNLIKSEAFSQILNLLKDMEKTWISSNSSNGKPLIHRI